MAENQGGSPKQIIITNPEIITQLQGRDRSDAPIILLLQDDGSLRAVTLVTGLDEDGNERTFATELDGTARNQLILKKADGTQVAAEATDEGPTAETGILKVFLADSSGGGALTVAVLQLISVMRELHVDVKELLLHVREISEENFSMVDIAEVSTEAR